MLGSPAVGKSVVTLNWAVLIDSPSVIINLDTPDRQQAYRMVAIDSGVPYHTVKDNPDWAVEYITQNLRSVRGYNSVGNREATRVIDQMIKAEAEYWGEPPALTIIDNMRNITKEHSYEAFADAFQGLHQVAMRNNTVVVALNHVVRAHADMATPLSMWSGQFAGEQDAAIVLGLWRANSYSVNVSVLKQREGPFDPTGGDYCTLMFDHTNYSLS